MAYLYYIVFTIVLSSASSSADASLIFDAADVKVTPGQSLTLSCGVRQDFRHCLWENERGDIFQVEDVHAGVHLGMRAPEDLTDNQCGVVIDSVSVQDHGTWSCKVLLAGRTLVASRNVLQTCPEPFVLLGGGCYYFHTSTSLSWQDAREYCWSMGTEADLAVVNDCHQFTVIWDHILIYYTGKWFWIGGTDLGQEGEWYFIDGSPVPMGTPFWLPGSPNDEGNCLDISAASGYFNDYPCVNKGFFICQHLL